MAIRKIERVIQGVATSDGAGVKLKRSIGSTQFARIDPFLMLDEFFSDNPDDYIAGFPSHPHRGFETVTYMLDGHMRHEDSVGNKGDLGPGDVQWMSAARGIIHSEIPQQTEGRMRGFQLWINLPATHKMKDPSYKDVPAASIPVVDLEYGGQVKVIAGSFSSGGSMTSGPVPVSPTNPVFYDVTLEDGGKFELPIAVNRGAFLYLYEGNLSVGVDRSGINKSTAVILSSGEEILLTAGEGGARFLFLAADPINEPVVQYGPFVMNTREEIDQAIEDYQSGRLTQ
jgi:redox-sensitive bicupin YhaK (pirin superfamily)